jgi:hypothetical protein
MRPACCESLSGCAREQTSFARTRTDKCLRENTHSHPAALPASCALSHAEKICKILPNAMCFCGFAFRLLGICISVDSIFRRAVEQAAAGDGRDIRWMQAGGSLVDSGASHSDRIHSPAPNTSHYTGPIWMKKKDPLNKGIGHSTFARTWIRFNQS